MRPMLAGLCVLTLLVASPGRAAENVVTAADENTCDAVCEVQRYLNTDHMVTLAPAPAPPRNALEAIGSKPAVQPPLRPRLAARSRARTVLAALERGDDEHDVVRKPVPTFRHHALDPLEHVVVRKPVPTFRHHALDPLEGEDTRGAPRPVPSAPQPVADQRIATPHPAIVSIIPGSAPMRSARFMPAGGDATVR